MNGAKPITVIDIGELDFDSEAGDKDRDRQRQVDELDGEIQLGGKLEETVVDQSIESLALDSLGHIEESFLSRNRNEKCSENFEWLEPGVSLPLLEAPLPTGVACCLTRLIQLGLQTVTFYLSGLAQSVPLACTERCIYTRNGDNTSYCFSSPPSSSCLSNPGPPVPMHQPLKTENSSQQVPGMRAGPACCPVKQVVGSDDAIGLFVLSTSLPGLPPSHCLDSCVYNKVGDVRRSKYCFSRSSTASVSCHRKIPSLTLLMDRNPDHYEVPALLDPKRDSKKIEKNGTTTDKETENTAPKTMWITLEQSPADQNGTDSAIEDVPAEKITRKDSDVCVAKEAESVEIISL